MGSVLSLSAKECPGSCRGLRWIKENPIEKLEIIMELFYWRISPVVEKIKNLLLI